VQRAELVAGGIAQIGKVELAEAAFADAGGILARGAAIGDAGGVPGIGDFRRRRGKADGAAIGVAGGLAVDRRRNGEDAGRRHVEDAALVVLEAGADAERGQRRVIELLRSGDVVRSDHYVAEHVSLPCAAVGSAGAAGMP